jgi:hypothetical protein
MCHEVRFFKSWAKRTVQKREESAPQLERASPAVQPIRPPAERETTRRRDVEREPAEIV